MVDFGVQGLEIRVRRDRLWTAGFQVQRSAVGVSALGVWGLKFGVWCLVFNFKGLGVGARAAYKGLRF